jgi:hypothetical protein
MTALARLLPRRAGSGLIPDPVVMVSALLIVASERGAPAEQGAGAMYVIHQLGHSQFLRGTQQGAVVAARQVTHPFQSGRVPACERGARKW